MKNLVVPQVCRIPSFLGKVGIGRPWFLNKRNLSYIEGHSHIRQTLPDLGMLQGMFVGDCCRQGFLHQRNYRKLYTQTYQDWAQLLGFVGMMVLQVCRLV